MTSVEIQQRCETIEKCYEYSLSYAAQGHGGESGNDRILRDHLQSAAAALADIANAKAPDLGDTASAAEFFAVLAEDTRHALAAVRLVLAQPAIGSQMIDSLNASIHVRALLADLFLVTEIITARSAQPAPSRPL